MPTSLQYIGFNGLNFRDFQVRTGPKGTTTHFTVTSPILASLINYQNYIQQFGATISANGLDGGDVRSLEVEVPGLTSTTVGIITELFFDQWELLTNESSDTIFANPLLVSGTAPVLNYNAKTILSRYARNGGTLAEAMGQANQDILSNGVTAPTPANGGTAGGKFTFTTFTAAQKQIALEVAKTQTEYERPTYVLRHTSYCSAGANYNAAAAHVMQIYTPGQLLTECGSGWTYNLPNRLYSKIAGINAQSAPGDEASYYTWGWLKKITREPVLANFMVEVSTEYELGLWSNLRYATR